MRICDIDINNGVYRVHLEEGWQYPEVAVILRKVALDLDPYKPALESGDLQTVEVIRDGEGSNSFDPSHIPLH